MRFAQGPLRGSPPVRVRVPVFAVGRRVYVTCSGGHAAHVALTDDAGANALASLTDGTEVEILGWRPRGFGGTRYRVRTTRNGVEGWLAVGDLRSTQSAVSSAPTGPTAPATGSAPLQARGRGSQAPVGPALGRWDRRNAQ
jgi:hypothetical protein